MRVKIKRLNDKAVIPYKTHESDFCFDCVAVSEQEIAPNVWKYGLGFALEPETTWEHHTHCEPVSFAITARPRSSVWRTGMVLSNCIGTIDEDYRGEVSAVFYHVLPMMPRYKVGDRVCQIHLEATKDIQFVETDTLSETERGTGGYGSTGK